MLNKVRKAVFPVAGLGSRFLPATKANPKEMLPIVDKPLIQYAVEEAVKAGCTEMIFVTNGSKRAIEDHFDKNFELEARLEEQQKHELLELARNVLPAGVSCIYLRQPEPRGLGDAVWQAQKVVNNEPFAVLLADDLIKSPQDTCLQQMLAVHEKTQSSVVAVETIAKEQTHKYGIVSIKASHEHSYEMNGIVEKPQPSEAPSCLGVVGRYILTPQILPILAQTARGRGGEVQLTDAIGTLLRQQPVYAHAFQGKRYDCGDKLGYLEATVAYGLEHETLGDDFRAVLQNYL